MEIQVSTSSEITGFSIFLGNDQPRGGKKETNDLVDDTTSLHERRYTSNDWGA
jgi:hypothetical protein